MKDAKEHELIDARDEAHRKRDEANCKWWKYRKSKA